MHKGRLQRRAHTPRASNFKKTTWQLFYSALNDITVRSCAFLLAFRPPVFLVQCEELSAVDSFASFAFSAAPTACQRQCMGKLGEYNTRKLIQNVQLKKVSKTQYEIRHFLYAVGCGLKFCITENGFETCFGWDRWDRWDPVPKVPRAKRLESRSYLQAIWGFFILV